MSKKKVMAGAGLVVPFPLSVYPAPGARHFFLEGEETIEVDCSHPYVAKRIRVGDLVVVKQTRKPKQPAKGKKASAAQEK